MVKHFKIEEKFLSDWLKALRSGEYEQGDEYLSKERYDSDTEKTSITYCCLGIAGICAGLTWEAMENEGLFLDVKLSSEHEKKLPGIINQGCFSTDKKIRPNLVEILTKMNDGMWKEYYEKVLSDFDGIWFPDREWINDVVHNFSFQEIAEFLEKNVEPVKTE